MKTSHERGEQKRFLQLFINPFKAAQGQRVLSPADFKGEARALKFREEPIFEAAVACEAVIFYQAVTAGGGKILPSSCRAAAYVRHTPKSISSPWL